MATQTQDALTDVFKQACDSFNTALQTGTKFQQDLARSWTETAGMNLDEARERFDKATHDFAPVSKKNLERFERQFDEQTRQSFDLLRQAFDAGKPADVQEMYERTQELWQASFDALRSTTDSFAKTNTEFLASWSKMFRTGCGSTNGKSAGKASKQ